MNNHQRQIKAESDAVLARRGSGNRLSLYSVLLCFLLFSFVGALRSGKINTSGSASPSEWQLLLVNSEHPLPTDFTVNLAEVSGKQVDVRIAQPLQKMLADAHADGVPLYIACAYRSVKEQAALCADVSEHFKAQGLDETQAARRTDACVQPPGASEHHTGLAVDFTSDPAAVPQTAFQDTPAYAWLSQHAVDYGFIERYPKDKQSSTGIAWQPWHYRYVDAKNAQLFQASGVVLEEYAKSIREIRAQ